MHSTELWLKLCMLRLKQELGTLRDVQGKNAALVEEVRALESQVDELKLAVDDAHAAEEMVESLTEKNLELEDRCACMPCPDTCSEELCVATNEILMC